MEAKRLAKQSCLSFGKLTNRKKKLFHLGKSLSNRRKSVHPFTLGDLRDFHFDNGTRLFAELWQTCTVADLKSHGCKLGGFECRPNPNLQLDADALLSFSYYDFEFFVVSSQSEYMFYVSDGTAPDSILMAVAEHFNKRLRQTTTEVIVCDENFIEIKPNGNPQENKE